MANSINILWKNGFGNQLFQYSYCRILAKQMGCALTYGGTIDRWEGTSLIDVGFLTDSDIKKHTDENIEVNFAKSIAVPPPTAIITSQFSSEKVFNKLTKNVLTL